MLTTFSQITLDQSLVSKVTQRLTLRLQTAANNGDLIAYVIDVVSSLQFQNLCISSVASYVRSKVKGSGTDSNVRHPLSQTVYDRKVIIKKKLVKAT